MSTNHNESHAKKKSTSKNVQGKHKKQQEEFGSEVNFDSTNLNPIAEKQKSANKAQQNSERSAWY